MEWAVITSFVVVGIAFSYILFEINSHATKTDTKHSF